MAQFSSEDDVRYHYIPAYLEAKGYDPDNISFNVTIKVNQGRKSRPIFADAVVFSDPAKTVPLVVVETKGPEEVVTEDDRDQGISYARLHDPMVPVVLLSNGYDASTKAYDAFTRRTYEGGLPAKDAVLARLQGLELDDASRGVLVQEAKHEIFRVEDVQEYKRILRASHNIIRNNEGYDPTKAFDELSKVMFCKLYEEQRAGDSRFRASVFDDALDRLGTNIIVQVFDETKRDPHYSSLFDEQERIELNDRTVRELVRQFENYDLSLTGFDVKGEAFEHFLSDTFTGGLGQYFTPRNVVRFIVDALDPPIGSTIIDNFCGTGGFLIYTHEQIEAQIKSLPLSEEEKLAYLRQLSEELLHGIDWNDRTSRACRMNMVVHGEGDSGKNIFKQSGFINRPGVVEDDLYDFCITNPPFGSSETDQDILKMFEVSSGRKSIERAALALERAVRLVKPEGRVGIIVMDGILSNASFQFVRDWVMRHAWVRGLVSLPPETFEGYGGRADTTVLLLERKTEPDHGAQDPAFMAVCRNSGYAPNGAEVPGNELPAILEALRAWEKGENFDLENAWESELGKRLDAKHYWRPKVTRTHSPETLLDEGIYASQDHEAALRDLRARVAALAADAQTRTVRVGDLVSESKTRVKVKPGTEYPHVGVRQWGRGTFVRETKDGAEVKAPTVHPITQGQLIYNRLFAYKGSFAIVNAECDGAYVSNEFPVYEAREDAGYDPDLLLRYLVHALNAPQYLAIVDAHSSGSTKTSRNRLRQDMFEGIEVTIPVDETDIKPLVELMDAADALREEQEQALQHAKLLRESLTVFIPSLQVQDAASARP